MGGDLPLCVHRRHRGVARRPRVHLAAAARRVGQLVGGALGGVKPRQDRLPRLDHHGLVDLEVGAPLDVREDLELFVVLGQEGS